MIDISIIIPCYNSSKHIEKRVKDFSAILGATKFSHEILLCDDGSGDESPQLCEKLAKEIPLCRYIPSSFNRGRGRNVADGALKSEGRIIGFADADSSTPAYYVLPVVQALEAGADVAEAHRTYKIYLPHFPFIFHRLFAHVAYKQLVQTFLGIQGHDTETGFKFFKRESLLKLIDVTTAPGWFWDTEIIGNAHLMNMKVVEVPSLFIREKGMGTTVKFFRDSARHFVQFVRYAWRHRKKRFKQDCCQCLFH